MTKTNLIFASLAYHWRTHAAVLLCVAVATAVLTGALLVGDSMRGSLREIALDRLGKIDFALTYQRLFGGELTDRIDHALQTRAGDSPKLSLDRALLLRGSVARVDSSGRETDRAGKVRFCGVTGAFWSLNRSGTAPAWSNDWDSGAQLDSIAINDELARDLNAKVGDTVIVRIEKPSEIPREAVLGRKDDSVVTRQLRVARIVPVSELGHFALDAGQRVARNAYVPLGPLAQAIGSASHANTIFAVFADANDPSRDRSARSISKGSDDLRAALTKAIQLDDIGLRIRFDAENGYVSLESRRMVLEPAVAKSAEAAGRDLDNNATPIIAYLANSIRKDGESNPARAIPYSTVAAIRFDEEALESHFTFRDQNGTAALADDEILLNTWAADDLECHVGDRVTIEYYVAEPSRPFETAESTFRVRGIVEIEGIAADRGLVPEYPGITNAKRYADWDPPFPMDLKRIRAKDEAYWDKYRATPKAFLSFTTAERLWGSRFGEWTSIQLKPRRAQPTAPRPTALAEWSSKFAPKLLAQLNPESLGLVFQPVKAQALAAATGGTDFGGLFIGFSFFLIVAAAILIGLVFRLGIERRAKHLGLLLAIGLNRSQVRNLLMAEGLAVAVVGTILGIAGAVGYASLVMAGLRTWWLPAVGTTMLRLHTTDQSLAIGAIAGLVVAAIAMALSLRGLGKLSPRALLAGSVTEPRVKRPAQGGVLAIACWVCALVAAGYAVGFGKSSPVPFFIVGTLILIASLALVGMRGDEYEGSLVRGTGLWAIARLGRRNAVRNRWRSVLTVGLVAFATFVIVAVGANRQVSDSMDVAAAGDEWWVAESSIPVLHDLNTETGRRDLGMPDESSEWMGGVRVLPFRLKEGEDASCLNLYQPTRPRILGVPTNELTTDYARAAHQQSKFSLLDQPASGDVIPAIGDENSVKWILHLGLGERLPVVAEDGRKVDLEIVGYLERSVFQSELLISEANFRKLFPSQSGYSYFLIHSTSAVDAATRGQPSTSLATLLEQNLADYGFDVTPLEQRIAEYHAVENTYLATFQMLGGLGLLLGTIGLGAVVLRGVLERRGELALLLAVGFRPTALAWLVIAETVSLLLIGLATGTVAALAAVAPHVLAHSFEVPWLSLVGTLGLVLMVGLASSAVAVFASLRTPLLPALRSE